MLDFVDSLRKWLVYLNKNRAFPLKFVGVLGKNGAVLLKMVGVLETGGVSLSKGIKKRCACFEHGRFLLNFVAFLDKNRYVSLDLCWCYLNMVGFSGNKTVCFP